MPDVNNPPKGGFKEGGWYWDPAIKEARQYYGGQFGAGTTIANPEQQGYGQRVSEETQAQSGYVAPRPTTQEGVTPYLNEYQQGILRAKEEPQTRTSAQELTTTLQPTTPRPETISRVDLRAKREEELGVRALEETMSSARAEYDEIVAQKRQRVQGQRGQGVALNVVAGRISEIERQENERLDEVGRRMSRINDQLIVANNIVNQYVQDSGLDYQDAVDRYDTEFSQNLKIANLVLDIRADERDERKLQQSIASANLTTMMNAVQEGNLDYNSMSPDQKLAINKLEIQAGLPIGTMSQVRMDADANVLFTTSNEGITQIGIRNSDGTVRVESHGTRTSTAKDKVDTVNDINTDTDKYVTNEIITWNGKTGKAQNLISPEAFHREMVKNYPSNISDIPTAKEIREETGQ